MTTLHQTGLDFARAWEAGKRLCEADLAGIAHGLRGLPPEIARCVLDRLRAKGRLQLAWSEATPSQREGFQAVTASLRWKKTPH